MPNSYNFGPWRWSCQLAQGHVFAAIMSRAVLGPFDAVVDGVPVVWKLYEKHGNGTSKWQLRWCENSMWNVARHQ